MSACGDPVRTQLIDELGPELPNVRRGPEHRAGQPCLACHSPGGGAPDFQIAGTVYATRDAKEPAVGAIVTVKDAAGVIQTYTTNKVGNFYPGSSASGGKGRAGPSQVTLTYPLQVSITQGSKMAEMKTLINGSGACATCHKKDGALPVVFLDGAPPLRDVGAQ
jgi:mono/diheme cytochrome c family protein